MSAPLHEARPAAPGRVLPSAGPERATDRERPSAPLTDRGLTEA
ncbi:hypothetical protein [Streptomyces sp. KMM 9044]|nr:hypothetical protein [Streptomyces sp. KMM 9044]WAX81351.1 hypothetical protein HUV60_030590 [Streptomyces sp. KMM 9044]